MRTGRRLAAAAAGLGAAVLAVGLVVAVPVAGAASVAPREVATGATPAPAPTRTRPLAATPAAPAVPAHSGSGRRIVYSERTPQHVWLIDSRGRIVRDFPVSGRRDWPRPGTYRVFSRSPRGWSSTYGVSFRWMVRFAHGHRAAIGFHTIPRYPSGTKMHTLRSLGRPVGRGGCPHSADADARFLYRWASIGTKVVVVR